MPRHENCTYLFAAFALLACGRPEPGGTPGSGGSGGGDGGPVPPGPTSDAGGPGGPIIIIDPTNPPPRPPKGSCTDVTRPDRWAPGYVRDPVVEMQTQTIVSSMTLGEKTLQMHGAASGSSSLATPDNTARNLRGFRFRDGPRGVRMDQNKASTCFPVAVARAATFDMTAEYDVGVAAGRETLASGNGMLLAPCINLLRHPGWGRAQECYGEDPFLQAKMGVAMTLGIQTHAAACPKHFAANNIEDTRMTNSAVMDEQTLRENYLPHFRAVVQDAGAACIMAAYNKFSGTYCSEQPHLLTDILRNEWGFRGFVLSDWGATHSTVQACAAGLDVEMPRDTYFRNLETAVQSGQLPEARITDAATRIVEQKLRFKTGFLDQPMGLQPVDASALESPEHIAIAYQTALKSMVLLKNADGLLPLRRSDVKTIAVIGPSADVARIGDDGSSDVYPSYAITPFQGIRNRAGSGITVRTSTDASAAAGADVVVVVGALTHTDEGEAIRMGGDRDTLDLSANQVAVINQAAAMNQRVIVVLEAGGPITGANWIDDVEAIVMAWYPGMEGGNALADLLFGDANFGGRVPMTWPRRWEDEPVFGNRQNETQMDYSHGYHHFDVNKIEPLFPFGFGLSYTTFEYSNLFIPCTDVTHGGIVDVQVDVTNTGIVAGDEVIMVFAGYPNTGAARRHSRELKGFARVAFEPGQTKRVTIPIKVADLAYFDMTANKWVIEDVAHEIMVGPHAGNLPLKGNFLIK